MSKDRKVNVSVNDFPLIVPLSIHFEQLKKAGASGIELVPGFKSRFKLPEVVKDAKTNGLNVNSLHQPFWSIGGARLGIFFDESLFREAASLGINTFVFHPPSGTSLEDDRMKRYLEKLAGLQEKTGARVLVENMPWAVRPPMFRELLPLDPDVTNLGKMAKVLDEYGLGLTLDTSHVFKPTPHKENWFDEVFRLTANIHLSSFRAGKDHLPLNMGDLEIKDFINELERRKYQGLLTLEINYPRMMRLREYDYGAIASSVKAIKG